MTIALQFLDARKQAVILTMSVILFYAFTIWIFPLTKFKNQMINSNILFFSENSFRCGIHAVVTFPLFDVFIMLVIVASSISLAAEVWASNNDY